MDDCRLALLGSYFVLDPLAVWEITGMVKKIPKMSSKNNAN